MAIGLTIQFRFKNTVSRSIRSHRKETCIRTHLARGCLDALKWFINITTGALFLLTGAICDGGISEKAGFLLRERVKDFEPDIIRSIVLYCRMWKMDSCKNFLADNELSEKLVPLTSTNFLNGSTPIIFFSSFIHIRSM